MNYAAIVVIVVTLLIIVVTLLVCFRSMFGAKSKVKAFLCKEKDCEARYYEDELRIISLATFLQSLTLPQVVSTLSYAVIIQNDL